MDIETAAYNHLIANATLSAQLSTRIHPLTLPQNSALPAIVYQKISAVPDYAHDGPVGVESRMQFSCLAASYADAKLTARNVKKAFRPFEKAPGIMGGLRIGGCFLDNELEMSETDEAEENSRVHIPLDYIFLHDDDI